MDRPISGQSELHPRLEEIVLRHLAHADRTPIAAHDRAAFDAVAELVGDEPVILDSGCGTGASTRALCEAHAGWIVGIDKSRARLARAIDFTRSGRLRRSGRAILVRANVAAFWRLAHGAGWRLSAHYVLYPNPWPKRRHVMRRWHAHPSFTALLGLGGRLELRTNWDVYALEWAAALRIAGRRAEVTTLADAAGAVSPFEAKYQQRDHALWRVVSPID